MVNTRRCVDRGPDGLALDRRLRARGRASDAGPVRPTVLPAVVAAGYDRDFDEVLAGARAALQPAAPCRRWDEIEIRGRSLRLPPDAALDLGGSPGWTVDLAPTPPSTPDSRGSS
jgi:hypothetical protein